MGSSRRERSAHGASTLGRALLRLLEAERLRGSARMNASQWGARRLAHQLLLRNEAIGAVLSEAFSSGRRVRRPRRLVRWRCSVKERLRCAQASEAVP